MRDDSQERDEPARNARDDDKDTVSDQAFAHVSQSLGDEKEEPLESDPFAWEEMPRERSKSILRACSVA
jgi:hypothetical protein